MRLSIDSYFTIIIIIARLTISPDHGWGAEADEEKGDNLFNVMPYKMH